MIRFLSLQRAKETAESNDMREWLSGGAPPCQGGGRGFDSRLALFTFRDGGAISAPFFLGYRL